MYKNLNVGNHSILLYLTTTTSCPFFKDIGKIFSLNQIWWTFIKIIGSLVFKKIKMSLSVVKTKMDWGVVAKMENKLSRTFEAKWNFFQDISSVDFLTVEQILFYLYVFSWFYGIEFLKIILTNSFLYSLRFYIFNFYVCEIHKAFNYGDWLKTNKLFFLSRNGLFSLVTIRTKKRIGVGGENCQLMSMNFDILANYI